MTTDTPDPITIDPGTVEAPASVEVPRAVAELVAELAHARTPLTRPDDNLAGAVTAQRWPASDRDRLDQAIGAIGVLYGDALATRLKDLSGAVVDRYETALAGVNQHNSDQAVDLALTRATLDRLIPATVAAEDLLIELGVEVARLARQADAATAPEDERDLIADALVDEAIAATYADSTADPTPAEVDEALDVLELPDPPTGYAAIDEARAVLAQPDAETRGPWTRLEVGAVPASTAYSHVAELARAITHHITATGQATSVDDVVTANHVLDVVYRAADTLDVPALTPQEPTE